MRDSSQVTNILRPRSVGGGQENAVNAGRGIARYEDRECFVGMPAIIHSTRFKEMISLVRRIAASKISVLITGESGSGKELVARAVHHYSPRTNGPWIDINCGALPGHLFESELFGYEKGAFSGADTNKRGLFELAEGGTLFLDEVGELPMEVQVKLLRVLDGSSYFRLGGTRKVSVDVRIVAATNQNLGAAIAKGRFRLDLFNRLAQVNVVVPALRERKEDIIPLAQYFFQQQASSRTLSAEAVVELQRYRWPGNVRELRNVITRAALLASENEIGKDDLALEDELMPGHENEAPLEGGSMVLSLQDLQENTISNALQQTGGNQRAAAALLGISERTLSRKLKRRRSASTPAGAPQPEDAVVERRRDPRERVSGTVRLQLVGAPGYTFAVQLQDVSSSGFRVRHNNIALRVGDEILTDDSLGGQNARVVWTRVHEKAMDAGLAFVPGCTSELQVRPHQSTGPQHKLA